MADIESGVVETKILHVCAACCERAGWELPVAGDEWDFHSMALAWRSCSASPWCMELVASTPRLPPWVRAQLLEFTGSTFSDPMGDVPGPLYGWHDTESSQARSERAETGLIDTFGFHRHGRG